MIKYHKIQFKRIYRSTELFLKFLEKNFIFNNKIIIDIGCGAGANTIFMAKKYKKAIIIGLDNNKKLIAFAKKKLKNSNLKNCSFSVCDIKKLKNKKTKLPKKIDLVVSFHVMSFLDFWYDEYLKNVLYLKPESIACSSLFYDGLAELKIYAKDFSKNDFNGSYYNIFSLPKIKQYLKNKKYGEFKKEFMEIDIDLRRPKHLGMGSYTVNLKNNKKIIKSGPISLPHGYFFASK